MKNRDAKRELKVVWHEKLLAYYHRGSTPVYLEGVTLESRSLPRVQIVPYC